MKIIKGIALFMVAFLCAWILIFTFSQTPFKQTASARILTLWTPAIPIYLYVLGAFCIGLVAGLLLTVYNYISFRARLSKLTQESATLNERLARAEALLPSEPSSADDHAPPFGAEEQKVQRSISSEGTNDATM